MYSMTYETLDAIMDMICAEINDLVGAMPAAAIFTFEWSEEDGGRPRSYVLMCCVWGKDVYILDTHEDKPNEISGLVLRAKGQSALRNGFRGILELVSRHARVTDTRVRRMILSSKSVLPDDPGATYKAVLHDKTMRIKSDER